MQAGASTSCPVLAVRHAPRDSKDAPGWSLILPGGWVGPSWQALAYQGARPAGQREWRWVAAYQVRSLLACMHACQLFLRLMFGRCTPQCPLLLASAAISRTILTHRGVPMQA